jgi:hypothetical protein
VDPVPGPRYFSENVVGSGIERETSGSVARNSDHWTTEATKEHGNIAFSAVPRITVSGKIKAVPVTGCEGPQGCETSRLPQFLDNWF